MTIDDLKLCATDEQGRARVRSIRYRNVYTVLAIHQDCIWVVPDGGTPSTHHDLSIFEPILPSPHADLVRRLGEEAEYHAKFGMRQTAGVLREAIAALEKGE